MPGKLKQRKLRRCQNEYQYRRLTSEFVVLGLSCMRNG
jgi:hypothetical protein